jgi:hypothetical protein
MSSGMVFSLGRFFQGRIKGKGKEEVAFFEKKAPQKNFETFTRERATSPGCKKVLRSFFKSDRLLMPPSS